MAVLVKILRNNFSIKKFSKNGIKKIENRKINFCYN